MHLVANSTTVFDLAPCCWSAGRVAKKGQSSHFYAICRRLADNLATHRRNLSRFERVNAHLQDGGASAKRLRSREAVGDRWYPYYAGFSSQFARTLLDAAGLGPKETVFDPWNGSGTTTSAARSLSVKSIGLDANPAANLIASSRLASAPDAAHLFGVVDEAIENARRARPADEREPLLICMEHRTAGRCRKVQQEILRLLATSREGFAFDPLTGTPPPLASFLLLGLARAVRQLAPPLATTNPSWCRLSEPVDIPLSRLRAAFRANLALMVADLSTQPLEDAAQTSAQILLGDARSLPLRSRTVDFVLTSPPYLTRLDYAVNTRLELALLGLNQMDDTFAEFRARLTGTPLTRAREVLPPRKEWGTLVTTLLNKIRSHHSRDSSCYYYKQYWQYFGDLHASLNEVSRVLRKDGLAVFVVQNSYYKDVHVDLPKLITSMADSVGLTTKTSVGHAVDRVLTSINSRAQQYSVSRRYAETTVVLSA